MEKKRIFNTKMIVGAALLTALEIILQLLSMILPTAVNLNLALVVITIGAMMYGPIVGGFLGFVNGAVILLSPNTVTVFMSISPVATILVCLLKTTLAGIIGGLLYKLMSKKNDVAASVVAAIIVPVINTMIFALFTYFFFMNGLGLESFGQIFTVLIGINFIFEIVTNTVISPSLHQILKRVVVKKPGDIDRKNRHLSTPSEGAEDSSQNAKNSVRAYPSKTGNHSGKSGYARRLFCPKNAEGHPPRRREESYRALLSNERSFCLRLRSFRERSPSNRRWRRAPPLLQDDT